MGRIIVIEDNPIFADYVCRLLASKGFKSESTSNCNGARKLFAKMQDDDIVLADMRLPDGDGIALLEELRKQGRNNPYIVIETGCGGLYPQRPFGNEPAAAAPQFAEKDGTAGRAHS